MNQYNNQPKNNKIFYIIATALFIVAFILISIYVIPKNITNNNKELLNVNKSDKELFANVNISPNTDYIIYTVIKDDYQQLVLKNLRTFEKEVLINEFPKVKFSILWERNSKGAYVVINRGTDSNIEISFYGIPGQDSFGLVYSDSKGVLKSDVKIVGEENNTIYLQNNSKIYSLTARQEGNEEPKLLIDLQDQDSTLNKEEITLQIENWDLYQEVMNENEKIVGSGDCATNEGFNNYVRKAKQGSFKRLMLNGGLELVITPNYENWSNEKFISFSSDPTAICAAGGIYPLKAHQDKLLWRGVCSTDAIPPENTETYNIFQKCVVAEEILNEKYQISN